MIAVMNRIPVNAAYAEAFEARFADRATQVDHMPGYVAFRLLRPANPEEEPYVVMTFWESRDHFNAWTESDEFRQGHARTGRLPADAYRGRPTLEVMEIALEAVRGETSPDEN